MATDDRQSNESSPQTPPLRENRRRKGWIWGVALAGIFLPIAAATIEFSMRFCSSVFLDPCPTKWHFALWAIIPVANALTLWVYLRNDAKWVTPVTALVGASLGIAIVYSLLFLPILPFSLIGILMVGIGLCGFSPYLAVMVSLSCSHHLRDMQVNSKERHVRLIKSSAVIAAAPLAAFLVISLITSYGMRLAGSDDVSVSRQGVKLLRVLGSKSMLLRTCYELPTGIMSYAFISSERASSPEQRELARDVYYRVTGNSFNTVAPPKLFGPRSEWTSDFEFDSDVGGTAVSGRVKDLTMSSSRIDANIEPDALVAYTEWALTFKNTSTQSREARAEIALPSGGVVSRLTLWVNGEEREAAFSGRGKVRHAYQQVAVVQRRDPVLVTTCGPDRVLMQCFPVPADGGAMKVRIGITSPLMLDGSDKAIFTLPYFVERNFGTGSGVKHSLYIVSPNEMSFSGLHTERVVMSVSDEVLSISHSMICERNPNASISWSPDPMDPRFAIVQRIVGGEPQVPKNLVIVVDGSRKLRDSRKAISAALDQLPSECMYSVILAADEPIELTPLRRVEPAAIKTSQAAIMRSKFVGGIDNRPALLKACDTAMSNDNTAIVWLYGPQPLRSDSYTDQILQRCERLPGSIRIYAVPVADGRNSILADLEPVGVISAVPRKGALSEDIKRLFDGWNGSTTFRWERAPIMSVMAGVRASKNVARLWAYQQVLSVCRTADSRKLDRAVRLAACYQLVTPVSGAVVLETEQQYREAGLKPVDPASVPSIVPEPPTWIALGMAMVLMLAAIRLRRLAPRRA